MQGWALVTSVAGVTALLMWWRWRHVRARLPASWPGSRRRGSGPGGWSFLLTGLALMFNGWNWAVRHGDYALGVVGAVLGAISATLGVGLLLIQRAWRRR